MKKFKPTLICIAVLLVISVAAFVVMKLAPKQEAQPSETPLVEIELPQGEIIIPGESKEIVSIEIADSDGTSFAMDYSGEGVYRTATMRGEDKRLSYSEDQMIRLCQYFAPLTAFGEIGPGEDSDYGLDVPRRTIRVTSSAGEVSTLLIGGDTPKSVAEDGAYVRRSDSDVIYTIGPSVKKVFLKQKKDYRNIELFSGLSDASVITMAEYTPADGDMIKVVRKSEEEIKKDSERLTILVEYKLISPVLANTDPDAVRENFLNRITAIRPGTVVEDNPGDLAKYGLEKPARLRFETAEGVAGTLLIGKDSENGGTYVMLDGIPSVIETEKEVALSEFSSDDIVHRLLWFFSVSEISRFDYKLSDGRNFRFELSSTDGETKGSLNGKALSGRNPHNLYMRTIRFAIAGERDKSESLSSPEITVTAYFKDGKTSTLSLCRLNERRYAVIVDGTDMGFYVPSAEVEELLDGLSLAERGEEIPDMF